MNKSASNPSVTKKAPVSPTPDVPRSLPHIDTREPILDLRAKKEINLSLSDIEQSAAICRALSSEIRLKILKALIDRAITISELAEMFYLPVSSMSMHIKILTQAGLVTVVAKPGMHGTKKLCGITASEVNFDFFAHVNQIVRKPPAYVNMPIGHYSSCEAAPPCGIISPNFYLYDEDAPEGFYMPEHVDASLIWFNSGYLEYQFPNVSLKADTVNHVELSFELCSEAPGYNNEWPSDIDVAINGKTIATLHIKGDYGDRRGIYNPSWWNETNTQYGEYIILHINHTGCWISGEKVSDENIETLHLIENYFFTFRLTSAPDAVHAGGMNLFGRHFGDYAQDIVMKVEYV